MRATLSQILTFALLGLFVSPGSCNSGSRSRIPRFAPVGARGMESPLTTFRPQIFDFLDCVHQILSLSMGIQWIWQYKVATVNATAHLYHQHVGFPRTGPLLRSPWGRIQGSSLLAREPLHPDAHRAGS